MTRSPPPLYSKVCNQLFLLSMLLLFHCMVGFGNGLAKTNSAGLDYDVTIVGTDDSELQYLLEESSKSIQLRDRKPETRIILKRRLSKDEKILTKALHSRGYMDGVVSGTLDYEASPAQLTFTVDTGPLYLLRTIKIDVYPQQNSYTPPPVEKLGIKSGDGVVTRQVLNARKKLLKLTRESGYPFAKERPYKAILDRTKQRLDLTLGVEPGSKVRLGKVQLSGTGETDSDYLLSLIPWKPGILYHPKLPEQARRTLLSTGLYSLAQVTLGENPDSEGLHHLTIKLTERKHRTLSFGIQFSTDNAVSVVGGWEHRNIGRSGEVLSLDAELGLSNMYFKAAYDKPHYLRLDQKLISAMDLKMEETDAFESSSIEANIGVERTLSAQNTLAAGLSYRVTSILEEGGSDESVFGLFSAPIRFTMDHSNDLLNPTQGWRLDLTGGPYFDTLENGVMFGKLKATHSHYLPLTGTPKTVLAGRVAMGMLTGAQRDRLPADERYYVGGGGSLRGFGYQLAGPLNSNGDPEGGASMLEMAIETRIDFTDNIGMVLFVDGGRSYENTFPEFGEEIFFGGGVGYRYITPIGPLRLDVATPLNPRNEIDDAFHVYISIGQAF